MTTTFATDLAAALLAICEDQKTATPNTLRMVHPSRPRSYKEVPCAVVLTDMPEAITYDSGNRTRALAPTVTLVDDYTDNHQTALRLNTLRDLLVDRFTAEIQHIPNTILQLNTIEPAEIPEENLKTGVITWRRGLVLNFAASIREGRV